LDFIALGNVISMMHLLNREYYKGTMSGEEMAEDEAIQWAYWRGVNALETLFILSINGIPVPITAFAERSFLIFAAALVRMKDVLHSDVPQLEGCTFKRLEKEVDSLIRDRHSNLYHLYQRAVDGGGPIIWNHPGISIQHRDGKETDESLEFLEQCMFMGAAPGGNGDRDEYESEDGVSDIDVDRDGDKGKGTKRPRSGTSLCIIRFHTLNRFPFLCR